MAGVTIRNAEAGPEVTMLIFLIYHTNNTIFILQSQRASISAPKDHIIICVT